MVSMLSLASTSELVAHDRTAASVRATREQKKLESAWQNPSPKSSNGNFVECQSLEEKYAQWLEQDSSNARKNIGLFGQTILEEDDSSMDGY